MAGLTEGPRQYLGGSDSHVQCYNIRGGITDRPDLRLPFPSPLIITATWWRVRFKTSSNTISTP